jgi:murein DD-endopeptidase MepM/ murein hydrolase activator NlpD
MSQYGHLKAYAHNARRGASVRQGQVIGYVGATGLATGPHLDFRIAQNNKFMNFLSIKAPPTLKISEKEKPKFKEFTSKNLSRLADIRIE